MKLLWKLLVFMLGSLYSNFKEDFCWGVRIFFGHNDICGRRWKYMNQGSDGFWARCTMEVEECLVLLLGCQKTNLIFPSGKKKKVKEWLSLNFHHLLDLVSSSKVKIKETWMNIYDSLFNYLTIAVNLYDLWELSF